MFNHNYLTFIIIAFFLNSCSLIDKDQPIPFYLELKNPTVRLPFSNGSDTHKITDVWVFADGQILGVFPLPAKVPVIRSEGSSEITILAGIRNNGMNENPVFYPFYKSIIKTINPGENELINIPLEFQYITNAKIPVYESFESSNCFTIDLDGKSEPFLAITNESKSIGTNSGIINFGGVSNFLELGCIQRIKKSDNLKGQSYIELDYKGDGEIAVGIAKINGSITKVEYSIFIPGKEMWNKIYVDMTQRLSSNDYDEYFIVLGASKTGNSQNPKIYIDNIKHIHF